MRLKMILYVIIVCCWGKTLSIPQHLINEFKASLLPLFGLRDRPKLGDDQKPQVPEALRELYEAQNNMQFDTASLPLPGLHTASANTVRSFVHVESPIDEKFLHYHKFRLKFDVSSIPKHEKLKAAEVKLTREAVSTKESSPYQRVLVHEILQPGRKGSHGPIMRLIDSQVIDTRENSTISVDVFPAVERWLSDPKSNHGVLVVVHGGGAKKLPPRKHLRLRRDVALDDWWQQQPLLFTYTDDGKNKQRTGMELTKLRPKRAAKRHRKNDRDPCRRRQMYVDFRDVGWNDWIVAPLGYHAFYCAGTCDYPMPEHLNTTNHAIVQSLLNSMKPLEVPKPCCIPTQLSSMSMLYVANSGKVILKNYKDMVVVGCGCR